MVADGGGTSVRTVVAVSTGIHTTGAAVLAGIAVLGPVLVAETALEPGHIGALIGAANIGALPGLITSPVLVRRWGTGRALGLGCLVMAVSTGVFTIELPFLLALLVVTVFGAGWGISSVSGGGAILDSSPVRRRAVLSSIRQVGLPAGGVIAGALVPLLAWAGWRGLFGALSLLLCGLAVAAASLRVNDQTSSGGHRWWRTPPWPALRMGAFSLPLITAQWAFTTYLTLELVGRLDRGVTAAAAVFFCSQLTGVVARPALGAISDRFGPPRGRMLAVLAAICSLGLVLFGLLPAAISEFSLLTCVLIVSIVALGWNGIMIVAFAEADPNGRTTVDIAAGLTVMRIGNIVGPPAFGLALLHFGTMASWLGLAGLVLLSAYPLWASPGRIAHRGS